MLETVINEKSKVLQVIESFEQAIQLTFEGGGESKIEKHSKSFKKYLFSPLVSFLAEKFNVDRVSFT